MEKYTFTNCNKTGNIGCSQTDVNSAYMGSNLSGKVTINTVGIQEWIVPKTTRYKIEVYGAQGGRGHSNADSPSQNMGGKGAFMSGYFTLTQGEKLFILVGQMGGKFVNANNGGGGGGGTFVAKGSSLLTSIPLIVAGGGGGGGTQSYTGLTNVHGQDGQITNSGDKSGLYAHSTAYSQPGASFSQNASGYSGTHPIAFINGGVGGSGLYNCLGGFGGGGDTYHSGGCAGGYTGGSTQGIYTSAQAYGGGGGSYNIGLNQTNLVGTREGHGLVIISESVSPKAFIESNNILYTYKDGLITPYKSILTPTLNDYNSYGMENLNDLVQKRNSYNFSNEKTSLEGGYVKRTYINKSKLHGISKLQYSVNIVNFGTYRAYSDGTYARSAYEYKNPTDGIHIYEGATGDGVYRIQPDPTKPPFDVIADMSTYGGGWMLLMNANTAMFSANSATVGAITSLSQNKYGLFPAMYWSVGQLMGKCGYKVPSTAEGYVIFKFETQVAKDNIVLTGTSIGSGATGHFSVVDLKGATNNGTGLWYYDKTLWIGAGGNTTFACCYNGSNIGVGGYTSTFYPTSGWIR